MINKSLERSKDNSALLHENPTLLLSDISAEIIPSVKIIGFKNFIPINDSRDEEMPSQEQVQYSQIILNKENRREALKKSKAPSPFSIIQGVHSDSKSDTLFYKGPDMSKSISEITDKASEDEQENAGPFLIFILDYSAKRGTPIIVNEITCLEIECQSEEGSSEDEWLSEKNLKSSVIKLKENESLMIVSKKAFDQKVTNYSLSEDNWCEAGLKTLKEKTDAIRPRLLSKQQVSVQDLVNVEVLKQGVYGTAYRGLHRDTHVSYMVKSIEIKTAQLMVLLLNEIEILEKLVYKGNKDLINVYEIKLTEGNSNIFPRVDIIIEFGLGTLERYVEFKSIEESEWREEELLMITMDLINQYMLLKDLNVIKRDIKPSEIVIRPDFKGLKFFDLSTSLISDNDTSGKEIVGTPRFMSPEAKLAIKESINISYSELSSGLYSIGATIFSLIFNSKVIREKGYKQLISKETSEVVMQRYPILWQRYLKKLIDKSPQERERLIRTPGGVVKDFMFLEKDRKEFESYNIQKALMKSQSPLIEYKVFLPYLWELKNYTLIAEMKSCIVHEFQGNPSLFRKARKFLEKLADLYENDGKAIESAMILEELVEIVEKFKQEKENKKEEYDRLISEIYSRIGDLYKLKGKNNKALENYEKALFIEFLKNSDDKAHVIKNYFAMADLYEKLDQDMLALDTYEKVKNVLSNLYKGNLDHMDEAMLCERVGKLYFKQGRMNDALEMMEKAKANYCKCYGDVHSTVSNCHCWLGKIYTRLGKTEEAIKNYQDYCYSKYSEAKEFDSETAVLFEYIANYLESQGRFDDALEHYEKALHIYEQNDDEEALCTIYEKIGESYMKQKKHILAISNFKLCYQTKMLLPSKNNKALVAIIEKVGDLYVKEGENKEALNEYSQALTIVNTDSTISEQTAERILQKVGSVSPLAFLTYRNYTKDQNSTKRSTVLHLQEEIPLLIAWNKIEDVKGVLEKVSINTSLLEVRKLIEKESRYLAFFKYNFLYQSKDLEPSKEEELTLKDCLVRKEGFNYLIIKQDKSYASTIKERATY